MGDLRAAIGSLQFAVSSSSALSKARLSKRHSSRVKKRKVDESVAPLRLSHTVHNVVNEHHAADQQLALDLLTNPLSSRRLCMLWCAAEERVIALPTSVPMLRVLLPHSVSPTNTAHLRTHSRHNNSHTTPRHSI